MLSQIGAFSRECIWLSMRGRHVTICARCDVSRSATCRANYLPLSGRERLHTESRYIHRKNLHNIHYTIYSKIDAEWPWFSKMSQEHAHLVASLGQISLVFFAGGSMPTNGPMLGGAGGLPTDTAIGRPKQLRSRGCLMVSEFIVPLIHFPLFIPKMMLQPKSGHSVTSPKEGFM